MDPRGHDEAILIHSHLVVLIYERVGTFYFPGMDVPNDAGLPFSEPQVARWRRWKQLRRSTSVKTQRSITNNDNRKNDDHDHRPSNNMGSFDHHRPLLRNGISESQKC